MQSSPLETSSQLSQDDSNHSFNASQHGIQYLNLASADQPQQPDVSPTGRDASQTLADDEERLPRMKGGGSLRQPKFQRIHEYENASASRAPTKEYEGPGFEIVKKKESKFEGPRLDEFPNEVLTHILSHLPATSLSAVSLVSRRFHNLVTTPHAWRAAFSRFFPGQDVLQEVSPAQTNRRGSDQEARDHLRSEQRLFTRLTAFASWRSEYILRTRLLRSLARGKPAQTPHGPASSSRSNSAANNASAVVTYNSQLFSTVNHIHGVFSGGKKHPRFMHGTDDTGSACSSDPSVGKVDNWGLSDPQTPPQFSDLFPGDELYGLGQGLMAGCPNVMDVSQPFGMIYGEGFPGGQAYFRPTEEMRGRYLGSSVEYAEHQSGIPRIPHSIEAICAVWIAKSAALPTMTDGLVGIMTGSSCGVITAYSLSVDNSRQARLAKGEATVKWMLSPGVPIIAISVDESYNVKRKVAKRIWATALNALGEVFYLIDHVHRVTVEKGAMFDDQYLAKVAWETGRNAAWELVEPTRRVALPDPYNEAEFDGSYSPRSSSKLMNLSKDQLAAETREIESFAALRPAHFRKFCQGWDMRRRLEVDFAGDDGNGAGEVIVVIGCGGELSASARLNRFTRCKSEQGSPDEYPLPKTPPMATKKATMASLFGGSTSNMPSKVSFEGIPNRRFNSDLSDVSSPLLIEEWRISKLSLGDQEAAEITTSGIDMSIFALVTISEDPLMTVEKRSSVSSPFNRPAQLVDPSLSDIPGHRARFLAVGTKTGTVLLWDMRGPQSTNPVVINELLPLRVIRTDSPQISCLAVSALYIVHGGNDGLVQAWDPLASTLEPSRTINSRFSSRARRRLIQAEASARGVGINLYAAGAIAIDPDPTVLRGMVSLGTLLRYWSYSSSAADHYSSKKRRVRRSSERGHNSGPDRFTSTGRGVLMDYIAAEQEELRKEKESRNREEARLRGRFGVGFGGLSDEEALRYAEMASQESFVHDEERRTSDAGYSPDAGQSSSAQSRSAWSSQTVTPEGSVADQVLSPKFKTNEQLDDDINEAIRLSLLDGVDEAGRSPRASGIRGYDIHFTVKQKKSGRSASSSPPSIQAPKTRADISSDKKGGIEADDLEFALRLSLSEEQSRREMVGLDESFPALEVFDEGKGKGKA